MSKVNIGDTYKEEVVFTQEQVIGFSKISGDDNPLHLDAQYAATTVFKKPIVHGFLSGSVFSKVFGTTFPGEGSIYLSQTMAFKRPVFVEEPYTALFEVLSIDQDRHIATIKSTLESAEGKVMISGEAQIKFTE